VRACQYKTRFFVDKTARTAAAKRQHIGDQIKAAFVFVRANPVKVFGLTHFLRGNKVCAFLRHQN